MAGRQEDNDGSDIFWPGYVDATTNLILNLLFLLTILMVAVFMFALELGRMTKVGGDTPPVVSTKPDVEISATSTTGPAEDPAPNQEVGPAEETASVQKAELVRENTALKREVERLNMMLAEQLSQPEQAGGPTDTVDATFSTPKPLQGLDKTLATDFEIIVRFKDEAVTFTQEERDRLRESLRSLDAKSKAAISVEVPTGFSEAKRMGFYRAMAVRNVLLEMNLLQENIDVSVIEGKQNANASLVKVRSR